MIPLTRPVVGMMVFSIIASSWFQVSNISQDSIFITVIDLDTGTDYDYWFPLTCFFVEENKSKYNWLKEGF